MASNSRPAAFRSVKLALGMEERGHDFESCHEARTGTREVGIRVYRKNLAVAHGFQLLPRCWKLSVVVFADRAVETVSAWHHEDNVGVGRGDFVPIEAPAWLANAAQRINAASEMDHFWNPVTAVERRTKPLQ